MGYPIWVQSATRGPPKPAKTPMGRPEPPAQSPWVDEPGRGVFIFGFWQALQ